MSDPIRDPIYLINCVGGFLVRQAAVSLLDKIVLTCAAYGEGLSGPPPLPVFVAAIRRPTVSPPRT